MDIPSTAVDKQDTQLFKQFENFILKDFHPCVMAKTVFSSEQVNFKRYEKMGDVAITKTILTDLDHYITTAIGEKKKFYSFVATFPTMAIAGEADFEKIFWQQLQLLHNLDNFDWDAAVSSNPASTDFRFSLRGRAFYLIGMHPKSSRLARQAPCPAIVFNLHSQFEQLRGMGAYQKVRDKIRKRDESLQGSINPMLADFGTASEARQYSGKATDKNWKCPFHSRINKIKKLCVKPFLHKAG